MDKENILKEYQRGTGEGLEVKKGLEDNCKISHKQMCQLLKQETGLEWKEMEISGYGNDSVNGVELIRYGIALVNERSEKFNSGTSLYIEADGKARHSKDMIACISGSGWPRAYRNECQKKAEEFDWFNIYLINKGIISAHENEVKTRCGLYEKEIMNAIQKHIDSVYADEKDIEDEENACE